MSEQSADFADLWALATQFPDIDTATAELARTAAILTLPRGAIHVISDVHGEDKKLRHVINNASGALRPLIERLSRRGGRTAGANADHAGPAARIRDQNAAASICSRSRTGGAL